MTRSETGEARAGGHVHHASIAPEPFPLSSNEKKLIEGRIELRKVQLAYMDWFRHRAWRDGEPMPRRETKVEEAVD